MSDARPDYQIITSRSGKSVEPQPIGSAMKKDQDYMLHTNKSPRPHLDNFDYSVSYMSAALNNQQMTDSDKISFKKNRATLVSLVTAT